MINQSSQLDTPSKPNTDSLKAQFHSNRLNEQHRNAQPMNVQNMIGHIVYGHPQPGADWLYDLNLSRRALDQEALSRLKKAMISTGYEIAIQRAQKGDFQAAGWAKAVAEHCGFGEQPPQKKINKLNDLVSNGDSTSFHDGCESFKKFLYFQSQQR